MVAAALPAAMTEFQQHFAVRLRFEDEFLRGADPIRRTAAGALPAHERWRRQLFDAHLKNGRMVEEAEDRFAADAGVHRHIRRPPRADAIRGGDGAINRFRRCGDANAMDERGGHDFSNSVCWMFESHFATIMNLVLSGLGKRRIDCSRWFLEMLPCKFHLESNFNSFNSARACSKCRTN